MSDSLWPQGLYSPWNSPDQNTGVSSLFLLQGIFTTQDRTQVSHIAGGFFTSWATGKPKSTGVGSLSLLQWIFPTQESDWGLLHCRRTLCQLSYQGSLTKQAGASSCFVIVWHWVDSGWDVIFSILRQSLRAMVERKVSEWAKSLSRVRLFATPWTVTYQASPSMVFSRQEYWNGLPFPSPGDLPDPGIEPGSPALPTDALLPEPPGKPGAKCQDLNSTALVIS